MYLQDIKSSIIGYVTIRAEGYYIEKFINTCKNQNIYLGNMKREKSTIIIANVPVKQFKIMGKIAKKNKCKVKILEKKGVPFFLNKYKKRKIFAISLMVILGIILVLSRFVWNIEVTGNSSISSEEIIDLVKEEGLDIGVLKSKVDIQKVVEKIRLDRSDVAWCGIKVSGTNVVIKVVETDKVPYVVDEDDYCNIVATKDAMIVDVNAQNGSLQVKEGDVVKKGTVLIAGWLEGKYTGIRYVHATGDVKAKVWYSKKEKINFKQKQKKETGKTEKKYTVNVDKFAINFYKRLSKFENYDTISTEKKLKISSNFYLPINFVIKENKEFVQEEITYSVDEAKKIGEERLSKLLDEEVKGKGDIINKYINTNEVEDYIEVEVIYEVLENIGTEEKISF